MRTVVNVLLLVLLVVLVTFNVILRIDPAQRQFELFPQMAHSVPYDTYAANANFRDGKTLQPLVPGTIVRGSMPLHYRATPADAQRAGLELVSSVNAKDAKAIARGKWVYEQFCHTCHGAFGKGDGVVATRGFPAPPSLLAPRALQMRDGQMFHVLTYGQGNMPSYASQVSREDRWNAIAYVRTLQTAAPAVSAETPILNPDTPPIDTNTSRSGATQSPLPAGGERVRVRGSSREQLPPTTRSKNADTSRSSATQSPLPAGGERVRVRGGSSESVAKTPEQTR